MDALREIFAEEAIEAFRCRDLCELVELEFSPARRRVLVIEPHPDDAALSLAGTMWLRRHQCEFVVATLAGRSNYTSYYDLGRDFFDVDRIAGLRRQESELFARMLGGRHIDIGRTDAALRYRDRPWSLDYFRSNRVAISAATSRTADRDERAAWTLAVETLLATTASEEVWIPLGAPHADHVLTINACLAAFVSSPALIAGRVLRIYLDVPYAARTPYFSGEMLSALAQAGVKLEAESSPIGAAFEQKLRLVSIYASQFKIDAMRKDIEASARAGESARVPTERLWRISELPTRIDPAGIFPESADKRRQEQAAEKWLTRNRAARRVRLLLLIPTGRWASDLARLREVLPDARFEVIASPAAWAEVSEAPCEAVELRQAGKGTQAWALLALRLAAAIPAPTIFHVGERRSREAGWLARLWPLSDTLVVTSMNRVMRAVERRLQSPEKSRPGGLPL